MRGSAQHILLRGGFEIAGVVVPAMVELLLGEVVVIEAVSTGPGTSDRALRF
jgi:hypothetical protein